MFEPRKYLHHGKERWVVDLRKQKQGRHFFETKGAAMEFAESKGVLMQNHGERVFDLTPEKIVSFLNAEYRLKQMGITIDQALEIVSESGTHLKTTMKLRETIADCVKAKSSSGKRSGYVNKFRNHLSILDRKFPEGVFCHEIKPSHIEEILSEPTWANATRKSIFTDFQTFFEFVKKRNGIRNNPCHAIEKITLDVSEPKIYTPEECERWMSAVKKILPNRVKYFAVRLFGGLRASEAQQLKAEDFRENDIRVTSSVSKVRQNRYVEISGQLRAWLKWKPKIQIMDEPTDEEFKNLKTKAKLTWKKNALRKSYISYIYQNHGAKYTSVNAGHSEDMLFKVYRKLVTPEDAKKFEKILP